LGQAECRGPPLLAVRRKTAEGKGEGGKEEQTETKEDAEERNRTRGEQQ